LRIVPGASFVSGNVREPEIDEVFLRTLSRLCGLDLDFDPEQRCRRIHADAWQVGRQRRRQPDVVVGAGEQHLHFFSGVPQETV